MNGVSSTALFTGRHMLIILLAFFGVVFAANFTMAYFAFSSWTGLVVKNSYVASQEFNETTEKLENAAKGIDTDISYSAEKLTITLSERGGSGIFASNVEIRLGRPFNEKQDQVIALSAAGNGVFSADVALAKGQWVGAVSANIPGHSGWQRPIRLNVED